MPALHELVPVARAKNAARKKSREAHRQWRAKDTMRALLARSEPEILAEPKPKARHARRSRALRPERAPHRVGWAPIQMLVVNEAISSLVPWRRSCTSATHSEAVSQFNQQVAWLDSQARKTRRTSSSGAGAVGAGHCTAQRPPTRTSPRATAGTHWPWKDGHSPRRSASPAKARPPDT